MNGWCLHQQVEHDEEGKRRVGECEVGDDSDVALWHRVST